MSRNGTASVHEQCWEPTTNLEDIRKCIRDGHHVMIIMRGIPGSGKSHLACNLVSGTDGAIFNTDKYFMRNGVYQFDPAKLDEYHQKNWKEAKDAMQQGVKPVIIDNTNIFVAHMKPYITLAVQNLYEIYFVEPETEWKKDAKECARRNAHSVPEEKILHMAQCFEKISLIDVIKPTQLRTVPPLIEMSSKNDADSLLLSELDSSLTEGVHKVSAEKQEFEEAGPLSFVDSKCTLYEAMDLLRISSDSILEESVADAKGSTEQLFSLIPPQVSKKSLCTVGCQTSDLIRVFDLLDSLPAASSAFIRETARDSVDCNNKKKMKEKAVQAGDGNILLDIELLLALFPNEKPSDLTHILEIVGLKNAMTLLKEMNAHMNICAPFDKNKNVNAEPLSQTYYWWNETEFEETDGNNSPEFVPNFELDKVIPEKLPPCTSMQCCDPQPVPQGYYRMAMSVDMMEQLTKLFGEGENDVVLKTYVDLPIWLWRQIYFCWQGFRSTKGDDACRSENFGLPSLVNSDEEFARILQDQELAADEPLENGRHMSIAERLQLSALINDYSGVDRERIMECFRDNKFCAQATRNTLELFVNGAENIQKSSIDPSMTAFPVNRSSSCSTSAIFSRHVTSGGLSILEPDLKSAHKDACELQLEADRYNKQKHEMLLRAMNHREHGAKMYYFEEARKFGEKAKDCVAEINERLIKANTSSTFIDMHYMDVKSAIELLKAKLNAVDRPPELRRGRSGKKLVVLTGYGKLNGGQAKIRPAVVQWLEQRGYEYSNTSNKGVLIVECK